jgi:hypothetical protein
MKMIKEAIQYIVGLGNVDTTEIGNQVYSTQMLHLVKEEKPSSLQIRSLSGLVDYVKSFFDADELSTSRMVHVLSPSEVIVFSTFNRDYERNQYIKATAMLPSFSFDNWYDSEEFNIKLQSAFVSNQDRNIMLKVVGNIREDAVKTVGDYGVSQSVVAKTGISTVDNVLVPNPVVLAPYRTFIEVVQPESEFIFRMKNGPKCALFEADGGAWKLVAMQRIKVYLEEALKEEIEAGNIVVIA